MFTMPINGKVCPQWPCPTCRKGHLLVVKDSFHEKESHASQFLRNHREWEPSWIEGVFTGFLVCHDPECEEVVAVSGSASMTEYTLCDSDGRPVKQKLEANYSVKSSFPAIPIFKHSGKLPEKLGNELKEAFGLYWSDQRACANRVRSCIELILTHFGIKQYSVRKGKPRQKIQLHERIKYFAQKNPDLAESLFAVKWIGNAGSHTDQVEQNDLLDGFEIMEHFIEEAFDLRTRTIVSLRRRIARNRGPLGIRRP